MNSIDNPNYCNVINWSCFDPFEQNRNKTIRDAITEYKQKKGINSGIVKVYGVVEHKELKEHSLCCFEVQLSNCNVLGKYVGW